jgi:hypothetical protein
MAHPVSICARTSVIRRLTSSRSAAGAAAMPSPDRVGVSKATFPHAANTGSIGHGICSGICIAGG